MLTCREGESEEGKHLCLVLGHRQCPYWRCAALPAPSVCPPASWYCIWTQSAFRRLSRRWGTNAACRWRDDPAVWILTWPGHQTEMVSFLGLAFATGKQECGSRLQRKSVKHSYRIGLLLSFVILLAFFCITLLSSRLHVNRCQDRWVKISKNLASFIDRAINWVRNYLAFGRSHATPVANYSKVPKTCRQLKYKSSASKHLTNPEIKLPACPCPGGTLLSGMHWRIIQYNICRCYSPIPASPPPAGWCWLHRPHRRADGDCNAWCRDKTGPVPKVPNVRSVWNFGHTSTSLSVTIIHWETVSILTFVFWPLLWNDLTPSAARCRPASCRNRGTSLCALSGHCSPI